MNRIAWLLVLCGGMVFNAPAQDGPLSKKVTVDYHALPLGEVLKDLGQKAGVAFACTGDLLESADFVTYAARDQEAGRIATRILRPRGLRLDKPDGGRVSVAKLDPLDEFKIKPEAVSEFARKPTVTRAADKVTIAFESKAFCDATVAIENADGKIVRHLASGVLGENAPEPFQWNSKEQVLLWDGKDDQGVYVDDKDSHTVRVSLGLKPQFERTLYWSPYKRTSEMAPVMAATEEGVVVAEGWGRDSVRMYDHEGRYLRTIYPFPADQLDKVKGLEWADLPHGGRIPMKNRWYGQTLLTSGDSALTKGHTSAMGRGMSGIGTHGTQLALAYHRVNRITTTGATWGGGTVGEECGIAPPDKKMAGPWTNEHYRIGPASVAFSPDGKWIYLAGYSYRCHASTAMGYDTLHGVARMPADGSGKLETFLGSLTVREGFGSESGQFTNAASVDCDSKGRVYVADFMNDRVQIFSPEGKFLKSLAVAKPAVVRVHKRNDEVYVFSWLIPSRRIIEVMQNKVAVEPALTRFGPFDNPKLIRTYPLTMVPKIQFGGLRYAYNDALPLNAELDSWTEPTTIWLGRECRNDADLTGDSGQSAVQRTLWEATGIKLLREKNGKLEQIRDFGQETVRDVVRAKPCNPYNAVQRMMVNPATGKLYVGEANGGGPCKDFSTLLEIDPESGKIQILNLPFPVMDPAFDLDGNFYARTTDLIVRYAFPTFREIPWDYGAERTVGKANLLGALEMPSTSPVCYHQGGIGVSPRGYVVASCGYRFEGIGTGAGKWTRPVEGVAKGGKPYAAKVYPGRASNSTTPCIHVWDKYGKLAIEDAVPGVGQVDGVELDKDLNIYVMHTPRRQIGGKPYYCVTSETLMKTRPGASKVLSTSTTEIPMPDNIRPKRPPDVLRHGDMWIEGGAEWQYGGVGFAAFNGELYCACEFSRFTLDYFGRSIAPEPYQFAVAVLDSNGNLITRIGRCGNVDDGAPLVKADPSSAGTKFRSLGGDEVALFHACYVAAHTDRRIFISDTGNSRILSVKMNYQAEERIPLKTVPDQENK